LTFRLKGLKLPAIIPLPRRLPFSYSLSKEGPIYIARDWRGTIRHSGPDASTVIQGAINDLSVTGGMIFFRAGTYEIKTTLSLVSNLMLCGEGPTTILKLADKANTRLILDDTPQVNLVFKDLVLDGNKANQDDGAAWSERHVLALGNKTGVLLDGVTVKNARHGCGLRLADSQNVKITNCIFKDNGDPAAAFLCDHIGNYRGKNVEVRGSLFDTCTDVGVASDNCQRQVIADCVFFDCEYGGFTWYNYDDDYPTPLYLTVTGCVIDGNGSTYGFYTGRRGGQAKVPAYATIVGNVIVKAATCCYVVLLARSVIANNFIGDLSTAKGIVLDGAWRCTIHNNIFWNLATGLSFEGAPGMGVDVRHNYFQDVATPISEVVTPADAIYKYNRGYTTENFGIATFSGDGVTTVFNIAHGLTDTPTFYTAEPLTTDARASRLLSADATNITITFDTAPPSGTDNIKFSWKAEV